jgi:hypothetical protein
MHHRRTDPEPTGTPVDPGMATGSRFALLTTAPGRLAAGHMSSSWARALRVCT